MFKTVLVSAHHDDVALSVGAMAALGMFTGPPLLITVFSVSGFAPLLPSLCSVEEITLTRAKEDSQFASFIGAATLDLGFKDAPLRYPNEEVRSLIAKAKVDTALTRAIACRIEEIIATAGSPVLLAPIGHGGHVDHLTVRSACDQVKVGRMRYYLDQPYAGLLPRDVEMSDYNCVQKVGMQKQVCDLKLKIASFYPSQPAACRMTKLLNMGTSDTIAESLWKTRLSPMQSSSRNQLLFEAKPSVEVMRT